MKKVHLLAVAGLMVVACVHAESAHKGWGTAPAEWPGAKSPRPVVHSVGFQGPLASIKEPDPPTNAPLHAGYCFRTGSTVTVYDENLFELSGIKGRTVGGQHHPDD
jgi:hypothetical protein